MKDKVGNPEYERRSDYYKQSWTDEAVPRYFYAKVKQNKMQILIANRLIFQVNQQRQQLENALGIRH